MKLGVMNPVLNSYTLEEALRYLHGLGVDRKSTRLNSSHRT